MFLIVRLLATIAGVNLFTLAVFVGLATLQYNSILSGLIRERLVVLGETVRVPFQAVADLGVSIGTVRNADAVLERARMSDESIGLIHVISPNGEIVRSTSPAPAARVEPNILEAARNAPAGATWIIATTDSFLAGANIVGATGSDAGIRSARSRRVFERLMAGGFSDKGPLSLRERELVINRTCANCNARYEFDLHVAHFGERIALTLEQIGDLSNERLEPGYWSAANSF